MTDTKCGKIPPAPHTLTVYRNKAIFLIIIVLAGCTDLCANTITKESNPPDHRFVASLFERNCEATTPLVRVVRLRHSRSIFSPSNVDNWVFTIHGESNIEIKWVSDKELKIIYTATGDKPTQRKRWGDVVVTY